MGISGGIFNLFGNLASICTPLVIGLIVERTGSFEYALTYVGAMGNVGALAYLVIVGPLKRIEG
jgi:ACS family glucarate transporter-like MFS transporter